MSVLDVKIAAARAVGELARRAGRGGGTSLPGKVLTRLDAQAIERLAARLSQGCAVISSTNGKTTTAAMAAAILEEAGTPLVYNRAGANMAGGVASTLLDAARRHGGIDGELETIADRWAATVAGLPAGAVLACNADDPLIADLGRHHAAVRYFGVEDPAMATTEMQHASDSKHCRRCGHAYEYDAIYLGHLGVYHCPNCGQHRPTPDVSARGIQLHGTRNATFVLRAASGTAHVELPLPGLYNVYNALGAATLCLGLGVSLETIAAGLSAVSPAFGRAERITIGATVLSILLIKNPAGANEILRTLVLEPDELDVLAILNDRTADGRDISWIWDADFEMLAGRVRHVTCAGTRAAELALRLKYAGMAPDRLTVVPALDAALDAALQAAPDGRLFALPTYTALLQLRSELQRRGHVAAFWSRETAGAQP